MQASHGLTLNTIPFTAAGNLTADPELRFIDTGKPVTRVRIAVASRVCTRLRRPSRPAGSSPATITRCSSPRAPS
jgi:hypothetical protein